jgi:16S rRNA (adenine1518-N6/adenine1519-N6)-dimethyltransferase
MQTLQQIKALLESRGLAPKKSLGQNFLIDQNLIRKLVEESGAHAGDLVLEIGPGTGALTEELLARGCRVVACELDDGLAAMLADRAATIAGGANLVVINADCLTKSRDLNPRIAAALSPPDAPFLLVANLPYNAATPLIVSLLLDHPRCRTLAVTIQREVADRLLAKPSTKEYGGLSVVAQALCGITKVATLPRECFWPRPDVTSAMVLLKRTDRPVTADPHALSAFCRVIFAHRRKQLGSLLNAAAVGHPNPWPPGIRPDLRAEQLSVGQIESLRLSCSPTTAAR